MITIVPLLNKINQIILNPLIVLAFSVALLVFFWGLFQFISHAGAEDERREAGKRNILYGLIGMFVMVSVYGIIRIVLSTFGITGPGYLKI